MLRSFTGTRIKGVVIYIPLMCWKSGPDSTDSTQDAKFSLIQEIFALLLDKRLKVDHRSQTRFLIHC